jgi:hypothetical protein
MPSPIASISMLTLTGDAITPLGERPYRIAAALAALLVLLTAAV